MVISTEMYLVAIYHLNDNHQTNSRSIFLCLKMFFLFLWELNREMYSN